MTIPTRGSSPGSRAARKRLTYDTIRDRFMGETPEEGEALDFYVRLGMFIWSRWEAIASDDPNGQIVNEDNSQRWDDCTEREFDELRTSADTLIQREVARRRVHAVMAAMLKEPWGTILRGISWAIWKAWEHFWGALGLIAFALIFVWLAPHLAKETRATVDSHLPQKTSPYNSN